jgi:NTE family protein
VVLDWASFRSRPDVREANGPSSSGGVSDPNPPKKAGISLALGGGCARGWAHIGVLRALDEAGIEVSMIAGTSIGALVGGCYLAGKLDELEEFARSLTKRRIFGLLDINFGGNGLFGGLKLDARLREHLNGARFEDLPKPFVCVASEIRTGHEIWLSSGLLITAMRASYALPGVFELVVAVNLHYDLFGRAAVIKHSAGELMVEQDATPASRFSAESRARESRIGVTGVMVEAFNIIQDRISRARLAGDPPDLSLQPKLGHIGLTEFHRADEAIRIGYETTKAQLADLQRLQTVLA